MSRILFYIPAVDEPSGGTIVILEWAALLKQGGYDIGQFSDRPGFNYPFVAHDLSFEYEPAVAYAKTTELGLRDRVRKAGFWRFPPAAHVVREDDLIIVPEFAAARIAGVFPKNRLVLLVQAQDWLTLGRFSRDFISQHYEAIIATSDVCADAVELLGLPPALRVPLVIDGTLFAFSETKKPVIAYMPRRRSAEVKLVVNALKARGQIGDFEFRPLDAMSREEVASNMREALVFLAFSRSEGFGLPPAEAMAAGCLVIGYTGVGGDEYFQSDISFPISDGNSGAFVRKVEEVVNSYRTNPAPLDVMRREASARILGKYELEKRRKALYEVFDAITEKAGGRT